MMKTATYKDYLIVLKYVPHNGAIVAAAIPDNGATIRRTFYGYTPANARRAIINELKGA